MSASVDAPATAVVRREEFSAHSRLHLTGPRPAKGWTPFAGHRNQQQVREDEQSQAIRRGLGR